MKLYMFLLLIECICKTASSKFCYWNTGCPYKYFASLTPYDFVRGDLRDSVVKIKGCEPISIWALYRHGQRHPGDRFVNPMKQVISLRDNIASSYKNGKSSLCAQDVENLLNWRSDLKDADYLELSDEGYKEMQGLGKRLKEAFMKLLTNIDGDYIIEAAPPVHPIQGLRLIDSAKSFVKGLDSGNLLIEDKKREPTVSAPYANCGKFFRDVKDNPETYIEVTKYLQTSDFLAAKDRIQRRLGIDYALTDTNITALYTLCRYTSGKDGKFSPWCALFANEDLIALEYIGDMKRYYRDSHGSEFSEIFGQIPMADLLKKFRLAKDGQGKKLTAYFTHATMINMVYAALGLFKDENPPTAAHRDPNRKWRSSKISSFSTNFVTVLNRCTKDNVIDHNVVFYLNEEPLMSVCKQGICSWQEFEDKLVPFLNTTIDFCEFDYFDKEKAPIVGTIVNKCKLFN